MISRRHFLAVICASVVVACATIPPPQMNRSQIEGLKIVSVEIKNVQLVNSWPVEHEAFITKSQASPELANDIRIRSYAFNPAIFEHFNGVIKQEYSNRLMSILPGNRPVKAVVNIKQFDIPGLASRVLINQNAIHHAEISLVDQTTNQTLITFDGKLIIHRMVGGLGAPIFDAVTQNNVDYGRLMIAESVTDFRSWLNQSQ
jgi:hypothetical protein